MLPASGSLTLGEDLRWPSPALPLPGVPAGCCRGQRCQVQSPQVPLQRPLGKAIPRSYLVGGPSLLVGPVPGAALVPPLDLQ